MEVKYYLEVKEVKDVCSSRENINLRSEKTISLTSLAILLTVSKSNPNPFAPDNASPEIFNITLL